MDNLEEIRRDTGQKAQNAYNKKEYQKALDYFEEFLKLEILDSERIMGVSLKAFCLCKVGETKQAFELANSIEFPQVWSGTLLHICLKAGKYQEALDVLESNKMDRILQCGEYAHAYFGLGQLKIAHNILENIRQLNPFPQDVIAQLLLIYHDQNLKDTFTSEDLKKYLKKNTRLGFSESLSNAW